MADRAVAMNYTVFHPVRLASSTFGNSLFHAPPVLGMYQREKERISGAYLSGTQSEVTELLF
jgi:hypothetical protein